MDPNNYFALSSTVLALAALGFWAYCLVDLARTNEWDVRTFTKPVWVVLLVLTNVLGALLYFAVGRSRRP